MSKSKAKLAVVSETANDNVVVPINATNQAEQPEMPMFALEWKLALTYKDAQGQHTLGEYTNNVQFDTMKLLERAATMVGQQVFQKVVEDQNV